MKSVRQYIEGPAKSQNLRHRNRHVSEAFVGVSGLSTDEQGLVGSESAPVVTGPAAASLSVERGTSDERFGLHSPIREKLATETATSVRQRQDDALDVARVGLVWCWAMWIIGAGGLLVVWATQ